LTKTIEKPTTIVESVFSDKGKGIRMNSIVRTGQLIFICGFFFSLVALGAGPSSGSPKNGRKCQAGELKIGPNESHLEILDGTRKGKRCTDLDNFSGKSVDLTPFNVHDIPSARKYLHLHYPNLDVIRIDDKTHKVSMAPHGAPCSNGKIAPPGDGLFETETCKPLPANP
jgi:hypothetical protein